MLALLESLEPTRQDRQQAQQAVRALSEGNLEVSQLPETVRQLLSRILNELALGHTFAVVPTESDLTPNQAARYLNVSRPYLIRLLTTGQIPFHSVGTHKRIRLRDLTAYREHQDEDSEAALNALQAQAQELGMGY